MTNRNSFVRGVIAGCLVMVAADAVVWMLTPTSHPGATALRQWLTLLQVGVGVVGAIWLVRHHRDQAVPALPEATSLAPLDEILDTATVVRDYQVRYDKPIRLHVGDEVHLAREDAEFPGWWWCTAGDEKGGWVPADRLAPKVAATLIPGAPASVRDDYDSTELAVERGQVVIIRKKNLNWLLVSNGTGAQGWIPASHVNRVRD